MILFPIGHDQAIRRWPVATIAIIVTNLVVFSIVNSTQTRVEPVRAHRHQELERARRAVFMEYQQAAWKESGGDAHLLGWNEFFERYPDESLPGYDPERAERLARLEQAVAEVEAKASSYERFYLHISKPSILTFISHMFMHVSWGHVIFNMYFLWLTGAALEYRWGIPAYLAFYLIGGSVAALAFMVLNPSADGMAGASGAVAACMGAFMWRHWSAKVSVFWLVWFGLTFLRFGVARVPAVVILLLWLCEQLFWFFAASGQEVAFEAHIAGFAFGVIGAMILGRLGLERMVLGQILEQSGIVPPEEKDLEVAIHQAERNNWPAVKPCLDAARPRWGEHPTFVTLNARCAARVEEEPAATRAVQHLARLVQRGKADAHDLADAMATLFGRFPDLKLGAAQVFNAARAAEEAGDPDRAVMLLSAISRNQPDHALAAKALLRSGQLLGEQLRDREGATARFRALLERYPGSPLAGFAADELQKLGEPLPDPTTTSEEAVAARAGPLPPLTDALPEPPVLDLPPPAAASPIELPAEPVRPDRPMGAEPAHSSPRPEGDRLELGAPPPLVDLDRTTEADALDDAPAEADVAAGDALVDLWSPPPIDDPASGGRAPRLEIAPLDDDRGPQAPEEPEELIESVHRLVGLEELGADDSGDRDDE